MIMDTAEFLRAVDWQRVTADLVEQRAEVECRIQQRVAEIRAAGRAERLTDKEQLAAWQDNIAACDELLEAIVTAMTD
jgi:hypothetical protein